MTTLALSLALAFSLAPTPAQAQDSAMRVSIQAQPLGDALLQLGEQTPLQIFFSQDVVAGRNSNAVSGSLTPEDALRQLLAGTDIDYTRTGNNVTLTRASAPSTVQLAPVMVSGGILGDLAPAYAGGQVAVGGSLGVLGSSDVMDTPFSTVNYTSQLLENQQARSLADVVVNDASVRTTTSTGGFGEDFQIRGFGVSSGDVSVNGLYGLVSSSRVPMQIVDRVELLKGPGTLMRGIPPGGSIGGALNIVTKRADDDPLNRVTLGYSTKSNFTGQVDLGRRFGSDNAWGVRLNAVQRGGEATTRDGDQKLGMTALGVDYRGERLRWSADVLHQEDTIKNFRAQIGFLPGVTDLPEPPDGRINFFPGTRLTQRDSTIMSRVEYDITDSITAHVGMGYRDGKVRQIFPNNTQRSNAAGDFEVISTFYDSYSKTYSSNAGLTAHFGTGPVEHRLALGVNYLHQENGNAYSPGTIAVWSNIYDPVPLPPGPAVRLSAGKASETALTSYVLADTLSFADDTILLTLGARRQTVSVDSFNTTTGAATTSYKASATSPVLGLVVKPLSYVSVYANFTEGLTRGTIVGQTYANRGEVLSPFKSKQYEAGLKVDWGDVTTTLAAYQIARPAGQADANNVYGYFGEQRNRGVELSGYGELQPGLRLMASYALIQGKLVKTQNGVNQGNRAPGVPSNTFSVGLDWDTPWVEGLSVNGRAIHTSAMYLDNTNLIRLPAVTRFDVGARYHTTFSGKPLVLRANIENVADKRYWLASGTYATNAAGRTLMLSASMSF